MYRLLDRVGCTAYYKDGLQGKHDNINEISVDFGFECMAKCGAISIMRPNTKLEKVTKWAMIITTSLIVLLTLFAFFDEKGNVSQYIKLFQTMAATIQIQVRLYVLFTNKANLVRLRQDTSKFWRIEDLSSEQQKYYLWIYRLQSRIFQTYLIFALLIIPVLHLKVIFGDLPFYTWKPEDSSVGFWIVACITMIFVDSAVLMVIGFDSTFFAVIINVMNQFHILQWKISELKYMDLSVHEIEKKIDYFASYHAFLLNYVKRVDETYMMFFLAQYCSTVLAECAYMTYLTLSNNLLQIEILEVIVAIIIIAYQFTLICLPIAEIESRADLTGDAIFHSSWYDNDGQYKRKLYFMLMRCHRGCHFTAGGMTEMNRTTLVKIFQLCFSVWALLNATMKIK